MQELPKNPILFSIYCRETEWQKSIRNRQAQDEILENVSKILYELFSLK